MKLRGAMREYERRTGARLTYDDLAERTGLARATLEAIGSRPNYNTTLRTLDLVCAALDCDLDDLVEWRRGDQADA